jgi:ADP-ribosyl-[dinitrogen reductase] hydrolase
MIRQLILDGSVEGALQHIATQVDDSFRSTFEELFVAPWHPNDWSHKSNGYSIVCLAQAVWAVRTTSSFEDAVVTAVNLGDDADTVAAVTGAIAGALYGIQNIPARWVTYLHGHVAQPGGESKTYYQYDLIALAHQLLGKKERSKTEHETPVPPTPVHDLGVLASNALGATLASPEMGIVSLCRMEDMLHTHPHRREFYIVDKWGEGDNPDLRTVTEDAVHTIEAFLREGREVVVHCHGGRSRTGFILKAWYMRRHQVDHEEAEQWIENVWPHYATWNDDFMEFLDNDWSI